MPLMIVRGSLCKLLICSASLLPNVTDMLISHLHFLRAAVPSNITRWCATGLELMTCCLMVHWTRQSEFLPAVSWTRTLNLVSGTNFTVILDLLPGGALD